MTPILHPTVEVAIGAHNQTQSPQNAGLLFDRFTPDLTAEKAKLRVLQEVCKAKPDVALHSAVLGRWRATASDLRATMFQMRTLGRFITGIGINSPFETGFRFDRYGFPTVPATSQKGVARFMALLQLCKTLKLTRKQINALDAQLVEDALNWAKFAGHFGAAGTAEAWQLWQQIADTFGTVRRGGKATWYDAVPDRPVTLAVDVINPHHSKYYTGTEMPTAWQSPVPIHFLTVPSGEIFQFAVGWRGEPDTESQEQAKIWLETGLGKLGAGAKTNSGYGRFTPVRLTAAPQHDAEVLAAPRETSTGTFRRKSKTISIIDAQTSTQYPVDMSALDLSCRNTLPGDKAIVWYAYTLDGANRIVRFVSKIS
jgi:CRISPR-associated protein Cmr6